MKWLIVLILISCGKHEQPTALDTRDSDGDQIQNYQEDQDNKYIADIEAIGTISGKVRFQADKVYEIGISNKNDITAKLLVRRDQDKIKDSYFTEWSKLKLENFQTPNLTEIQYQLHISFNTTDSAPDELQLIKKNEVINLGKWFQNMKVTISRENLEDLLSGKAYFNLKKIFAKSKFYDEDVKQTVRNKTYRTYYFDGTESKILYISKDWDLQKLLTHLKILETKAVNLETLFFDDNADNNFHWYIREFSNGEKVIARTNHLELKDLFLARFTISKTTLFRENGIPKLSLNLNNFGDAKVYLRVRTLKTLRTFTESDVKKSYGSGGGGREGGGSVSTCRHHIRTVNSETNVISGMTDFFDNVSVSGNSPLQLNLLNSVKVIDKMDGRGFFWEMEFLDTLDNIQLHISGLPQSTYVTTGEYNQICQDYFPKKPIAPPAMTNPEGKLSFEIESFVEKNE